MLEREENTIQSYKESLEMLNLGSEKDPKEVKIVALLHPDVKRRLIELLKEYVDVFAWSYQDIPGLDTNIFKHRFLLKPECLPIKQKLRITHLDMEVKIKEEVLKHINAGFLVTSVYP